MSFSGGGGAAQRQTAGAPLKGVFPLDHFSDCTESFKAYMLCLKENNNENGKCREQSKQYLHCRMQKKLMIPTSMAALGFRGEPGDGKDSFDEDAAKAAVNSTRKKKGFVAGLAPAMRGLKIPGQDTVGEKEEAPALASSSSRQQRGSARSKTGFVSGQPLQQEVKLGNSR